MDRRLPAEVTGLRWPAFRAPATAANRHRDQAIDVEFEAQDKQFAGPVEVAEVNGPDIKAENDFGKTLVTARDKSINAGGASLTYSFPPHSYTQLRATLA